MLKLYSYGKINLFLDIKGRLQNGYHLLKSVMQSVDICDEVVLNSLNENKIILSVYSSIMNAVAIGTNLIFGKMADMGVNYSMASGALFCFIGLLVYSVWDTQITKFRH